MKSFSNRGFSLIEVVIALGIFTFCIIGIFGLLPVALNSVRSVKNTNNAMAIAGMIDSIWSGATPALISAASPVNFPGVGNFTIGSSSIYYFDDYGRMTNSNSASLRLNYNYDPVNINGSALNQVTMTFIWPPNSADDSPLRVNKSFTNYYAQ
jgi:uncharacterized protein (TIGR02598 family)